MILCDTGPLVALSNRSDAYHHVSAAALRDLPIEDMVTTWPCFTEAMYLLGRKGGFAAQAGLWRYVADALVRFYDPAPDEWRRMQILMHAYADAPMDLADASLVTAAEALALRRIFTFDQHFRAYRLATGQAFDVVP